MSDEQFEREKRYTASMDFFRGMLGKGIITQEQYALVYAKMLEKYKPPLGSLFLETT